MYASRLTKLHQTQLCPVSFTYATMFALESLSLNGETYTNSARVKKACKFLTDRQMDDGGWGESFKVSTSLSSFDLMTDI